MPDTPHDQVQRQLFLRTFFDVSPPVELATLLARRMRDRNFQEGELLFERGQPSGALFFVTSGNVALEAPGEEPWLMEGQSFLGAIDANAGQPHRRTARALTPVHAIEMHFEAYLSLLEDFFDFAKSMVVQGAMRTLDTALRLGPDGVLSPSSPQTGRWSGIERLDPVQRIIALRHSAPFGNAPVQSLVSLAGASREIRLSAGERLVSAGDSIKGLDLLIEGATRTTHDDPHIEASAGPGQFPLGVIAIVPKPAPFTTHATTDAILLRIPHEDLFDAMEEHFGLLRAWWTYMGRENHRARQELGRRGLSSTAELRAPTEP